MTRVEYNILNYVALVYVLIKTCCITTSPHSDTILFDVFFGFLAFLLTLIIRIYDFYYSSHQGVNGVFWL